MGMHEIKGSRHSEQEGRAEEGSWRTPTCGQECQVSAGGGGGEEERVSARGHRAVKHEAAGISTRLSTTEANEQRCLAKELQRSHRMVGDYEDLAGF